MKRISMVIALALAALVFAYSQTARAVPPQAGAGTKIQVTSQTLTSQPAGKPYVIDTSSTGKVFEIAAGIDYSRVQVRTARGVTSLSDLVRKFGVTGKFLLGSANALNAIGFGFSDNRVNVPPGVVVAEVKCKGGVCSCEWGRDCNDMLKGKLCDDRPWICSKDTNGKFTCSCSQKT